jgi:hypothetical protein
MTDMAEVLSAIQRLNARIEMEMGSVKEIMCSLKSEMKVEIGSMKAEIGSMKAEISSMGAKVVVLGKQMKVLQGATIESAVRKTVKKNYGEKYSEGFVLQGLSGISRLVVPSTQKLSV